jgi:hypothetical protein
LKVKRLLCDNCQTELEGIYELPALASLSASDQQFILQFVKVSGSLKEMAKIMGLSYPTVRNRLDDIINRIKELEKNNNNSAGKEEQNGPGNGD